MCFTPSFLGGFASLYRVVYNDVLKVSVLDVNIIDCSFGAYAGQQAVGARCVKQNCRRHRISRVGDRYEMQPLFWVDRNALKKALRYFA